MPMTTTGLNESIARFREADARIKAALEPVVAHGIHQIGEAAKQADSWSSRIAGQEFEHVGFLSGEVGFHELGFPHAGMVRAFEGDGVAPEPFHPKVYGGPGVSDAMTRPALGPATEAERPVLLAEVAAAVQKALS
jgi:hypothetical protein